MMITDMIQTMDMVQMMDMVQIKVGKNYELENVKSRYLIYTQALLLLRKTAYLQCL